MLERAGSTGDIEQTLVPTSTSQNSQPRSQTAASVASIDGTRPDSGQATNVPATTSNLAEEFKQMRARSAQLRQQALASRPRPASRGFKSLFARPAQTAPAVDENSIETDGSDDNQAVQEPVDSLVQVVERNHEQEEQQSEKLMTAINQGKGQTAAMHFLAARDAVSASTESMRHLRSAIETVRKGHKDYWGDTMHGTKEHEKLASSQPLAYSDYEQDVIRRAEDGHKQEVDRLENEEEHIGAAEVVAPV